MWLVFVHIYLAGKLFFSFVEAFIKTIKRKIRGFICLFTHSGLIPIHLPDIFLIICFDCIFLPPNDANLNGNN